MIRKSKGTQFNCFSPPIMVATVIIEVALALYTVWRYKMGIMARLVTAMLISLATFQVAEYFVCTSGPGPEAISWSRLGFVAITFLPPLGLHLMHVLAGKSARRLVMVAYLTMLAFAGFFLLASTAFSGHKCTGNYVIFQFSPNVTALYSIYYFGWIMAGIGLGIRWADELRAKGKKAAKKLQTVRGLIIGYLMFLVPTALAMTVNPAVRRGIPSVLCGFAVLLALVLAFYVLPRAAKRRG